MAEWPDWWQWDVELSLHVLKRMVDRDFSEVELRDMMEVAKGLHEDDEPGRWVIETKRYLEPWEVIVEPDPVDRVMIVITAYPVETR